MERALTAILRNARAQARLVDDLLDAERMTRGKLVLRREWVNPGAVLRDAVETVRPEAEDREVFLDLEVAADVPVLYGDPGRLTQVTWNLLSNALKYSPPGGSGLGLGLSIARRLTALHGGALTVDSSPGQGATFRLFMPTPAQEGAPAVATVGAPAQLPLAGVRVLLVPEERMAGQLMATALTRAGAEVDLCDPALAVTHARAARPDVLVSGQMGFGDPTRGLLAQVRRDAGLGLRAVALVNASRPAERARARREGYDAELTRPVDSVDLIGAVLRVLGRQQR